MGRSEVEKVKRIRKWELGAEGMAHGGTDRIQNTEVGSGNAEVRRRWEGQKVRRLDSGRVRRWQAEKAESLDAEKQ